MSKFEDQVGGAPVDQNPSPDTAPVDKSVVNTFEIDAPGTATPPGNETGVSAAETPVADGAAVPTVNPVRSAAGRLGAKRRQQLISYGKQYERDHHLTPGRQRQRQLVQLGKRYEQEHGLGSAKAPRKRRGDPWIEFLTALVRVIKSAHRPAVEQLVAALAARSAQK